MIKISLTASGHYFIPISQTNHTIVSIAEENSCGGFSLLSIFDISSKSHNEKFRLQHRNVKATLPIRTC